jgi:hypothetical protein
LGEQHGGEEDSEPIEQSYGYRLGDQSFAGFGVRLKVGRSGSPEAHERSPLSIPVTRHKKPTHEKSYRRDNEMEHGMATDIITDANPYIPIHTSSDRDQRPT